ncbi:MAG: dihydropteroate synthase [Deltaproteobacteria bacterium]|nr:dihydropteroate synthase [Deltaproteobacteria bacterium]MBW2049848.1 dihydropteroate synthase [Deltaproteobacteria bacterium]MBW2112649.1 dihydropteroate synthase [Deltaproteobacteria bacterium]MBW2354625.1 dihydropteroate synthase [Deltaproteobacteria bacterium]
MLIIAERINSSRRYIAEAVSSKNRGFIESEAKAQAEAGADYIDVNAGTFVGEEAEHLKWLVEVVQGVTDLPLSIDSPDAEVIREILPLVDKTPMINSITLEPARMEGILPLVKEHGATVIGLCQSEDTMAETSDEKVRLARELVKEVTGAGIPLDSLYIDPLVYPVATNPRSALAAIEAIERIMGEFPGVHTTCGLTNVSYGIPDRKLVNRTFLTAAICRGLDSAILDPTDKQLYGALKASLVIAGRDEYCMGYITAFREGRFE